jgi:hypothetical protein
VLPSSYSEWSRHPDLRAFRSSIAPPTDASAYASKDTSRCSDVPCKTRGQVGFATSFPVGLLHPLQRAGLSRSLSELPVIPTGAVIQRRQRRWRAAQQHINRRVSRVFRSEQISDQLPPPETQSVQKLETVSWPRTIGSSPIPPNSRRTSHVTNIAGT